MSRLALTRPFQKKSPRLPVSIKVKGTRGTSVKILTKPQVPHSLTFAEYLESQGQGNSALEKLVDGAAHYIGFSFDARQWYVMLLSTGAYTTIDFVLFHPKTAVYVDGIQHFLRDDRIQTDLLQDNELRDLGWLVIRLNYLDLLRDPIGTVRRVLYAF